MKNTSQLQKHPATKGRKIQPQTTSQPKPEKMVTLVFFPPDVEFCVDETTPGVTTIKFPEPLWEIIERTRKQLGITLEQFFNLAIREKLDHAGIETRPPATPLQAWSALPGLKSSIDAAAALLLILGEKDDSFGMMELARNTVDKLLTDFAKLDAAFNGRATQSNQPAPEVAL